MKEIGILFTPDNIRAIREGRKTQTRRVIVPQPIETGFVRTSQSKCDDCGNRYERAPKKCKCGCTLFKSVEAPIRPWQSPLFMPKWAARTWLEITDVRVERLQDISEDDAVAEGVTCSDDLLECECGWRGYEDSKGVVRGGPEDDEGFLCPSCGELAAHCPIDEQACQAYRNLWDSINAKKHPWASNPWVWAITFRLKENL